MRFARFYTYKDQLLVPTVAQAQEGFFLDREPVAVCQISDEAKLRSLLQFALTAENEVVPTPEPTDDPGSPILDVLGLRKWLKFEADAAQYSVHFFHDKIDYYSTGRAIDGAWRHENMRHISLPSDYKLDALIDSIIHDINADNKKPPPPKSGALMLLPPPTES